MRERERESSSGGLIGLFHFLLAHRAHAHAHKHRLDPVWCRVMHLVRALYGGLDSAECTLLPQNTLELQLAEIESIHGRGCPEQIRLVRKSCLRYIFLNKYAHYMVV